MSIRLGKQEQGGGQGIPMGLFNPAAGGGGGGVRIDDNNISTSTTWSSDKINSDVSNVSRVVGALATNVSAMDGQITALQGDVLQVETDVTHLEEKVKEIELFKFPNATIIGEPTIQNGQVSGFSTMSYLQFPFILDLHDQAFQIDFCFTTATNVQTQQNILDSNFGIALAIRDGKGLMAISSDGTSWNIGQSIGTIDIQSNTTYYARVIWNKLQYKTFLSTNGVNYLEDMVLVGATRPFPRTIFIGGCDQLETGHEPHPFLGTINLNKASMSINNNIIWQGMDDVGLATRADVSLDNIDEKAVELIKNLAKEAAPSAPIATTTTAGIVKPDGDSIIIDEDGTLHSQGGGGGSYTFTNGLEEKSGVVSIDKNNYSYRFLPEIEINGNPTITSDFVVSGFSDNDYLTMPCLLDGTEDSWEMIVPVLSTDNSISNAGIIDSKVATFNNIRFTLYNGMPRFRTTSSLTAQEYAVDIQSSSAIQLNTKTYIKVEYDSSTGYKMSTSLDNDNWTQVASSTNTSKILYTKGLLWHIGDNIATGSSFAGNIYANELSIKRNTDKGIKIVNPYIGNYNYDNLDNIPTIDNVKVQGALTSSKLGLEKASDYITPLKKETTYIAPFNGVIVSDTDVTTTGYRDREGSITSDSMLVVQNSNTKRELTHNDGDNFLTFHNYVDVPFVPNATICGGWYRLVWNSTPYADIRYYYGYYDADNHFIPKYVVATAGNTAGTNYFMELDDENPVIVPGSTGSFTYPVKGRWYPSQKLSKYAYKDEGGFTPVGVYIGTTADNSIQMRVIRRGYYISNLVSIPVQLDENKCKVCRICLNYNYSWTTISMARRYFKVINSDFTGSTAEEIIEFMDNLGTPISFDATKISKTLLAYDNDTLKVNNQGQLYVDNTGVQEALELLNGGETTLLSSKADVSLVNTKVDLPTATKASLPSNRSVNIELGATGFTFVVPADGYVTAGGTPSTTPNLISFLNQNTGLQSFGSRSTNNYISCFLPCNKGDSILVYYTNVTPTIKFVYANGAEEV